MILSKKAIFQAFAEEGGKIFMQRELARFVDSRIEEWKRPHPRKDEEVVRSARPSQTSVIEALLDQTLLRRVDLPFPYRRTTRFSWGAVPTLAMVQSVEREGYFSHYTAMRMHSLTEQIPKTVYFNVEQPATGGGGTLTQEGIDRAFQGKCRVSSNSVPFGEFTIVKLNGKNTGNLGVGSMRLDEGFELRVTDMERTLIDAVVRPIYAGGVGEVAHAFKATAGRVSVERIVEYLTTLNYTYPYHQAIGYYLERAGVFSSTEIDALRRFPIEFDFYLTYQLKNPAYNEAWRLFVPKGM